MSRCRYRQISADRQKRTADIALPTSPCRISTLPNQRRLLLPEALPRLPNTIKSPTDNFAAALGRERRIRNADGSRTRWLVIRVPGILRCVTPDELLQVYDDEVRASFADRLPPGWTGDQDGPLTRCLTPRGGFAMITRPVDGLTDAALEALVERTVTYFAEQSRWFEWKTFDHDPAALRPLLLAAGAEPEPHEALVLGEASALATQPVLPPGLALRAVTTRSDLDRIAAMESEVWGEDWSWLADDLESRLTADPPITVFVVEDGDLVVSAAWFTPLGGTGVAGLWGGSTLVAYRRRGIYRALVARRAQLAVELGYGILQVDASDDSRPILERLGLSVVGGTTPYIIGRS